MIEERKGMATYFDGFRDSFIFLIDWNRFLTLDL